jgi:hypothetical protein
VGINEDILRSNGIRLFGGASEEVLQHSRVTFHRPPGTRTLLFLSQKGTEGSVPAGSCVTEVNDSICSHFIPPASPFLKCYIIYHSVSMGSQDLNKYLQSLNQT